MKFYPISLVPPQDLFKDLSQPFDIVGMLFERTAQMESLQKEFSKILLMSKKKREKWIKENQDFIQDMLDQIRKESSLMVRDFAFNKVTRNSVTEYMVTVQQTLSMLEKIATETDTKAAD